MESTFDCKRLIEFNLILSLFHSNVFVFFSATRRLSRVRNLVWLCSLFSFFFCILSTQSQSQYLLVWLLFFGGLFENRLLDIFRRLFSPLSLSVINSNEGFALLQITFSTPSNKIFLSSAIRFRNT